MLLGMWSCSEETTTDDTPTVEELQQEINALRAQLEQKITAVNFEGSDMLLTFADGTTLRTPAPESVIPTIGENGKWWVYDVLVENLSLVKNYRTQFQDILTSGTPDELIKRINEKAQEVRAQKG